MKLSSWILGGIVAGGITGVAFFAFGLLLPGQPTLQESPPGASKPILVEAKKKSESLLQEQKNLVEHTKEIFGLKGSEGEHRVFVSAQLVYLPENAEPVQPLDRKMKTEDGIEVGWKIKHGLDPADPGVKEADPDGDGFNNLEEFLAKTDPGNKADSPAKESKLKSRSGDPIAMAVTFPEKSGGFYSIRFQVGAKRREFKGKPKDCFWVMAGPDGIEVFADEAKMTAARTKAKDLGQNSHVIPLRIISYEEKLEKVKDMKAGGVEVDVDNSVLVLDRTDAIKSQYQLFFSTPQKPHLLAWDVGEIRFFTPADGGRELGPFRLGETFSYEGKEFAVIARDGKKIQLRKLAESGQEDFWVPVDVSAVVGGSAPVP